MNLGNGYHDPTDSETTWLVYVLGTRAARARLEAAELQRKVDRVELAFDPDLISRIVEGRPPTAAQRRLATARAKRLTLGGEVA